MLAQVQHCPPPLPVLLLQLVHCQHPFVPPRMQLDCKHPPVRFLLMHVEGLSFPSGSEHRAVEDIHHQDVCAYLPVTFYDPFVQGAFFHQLYQRRWRLVCQGVFQVIGKTDPEPDHARQFAVAVVELVRQQV